jgi:putative addiction module antidote
MRREVTVRSVGESVGITVPAAMGRRLHLNPGDRLLAIRTDRGILLTPYAPETRRGMAIATRVARKYRNALRDLAK